MARTLLVERRMDDHAARLELSTGTVAEVVVPEGGEEVSLVGEERDAGRRDPAIVRPV